MSEVDIPSRWNKVVPRSELPVYIICRDLVSDLARLVSWLDSAGHQNITLLDNASSYPPLLEYLDRSPHRVVRIGENMGHRVAWISGELDRLDEQTPFVVTDPDVIPDEDAPSDSFEYMQEVLLRHRSFDKIGFGLHIDDLPDEYPFVQEVIEWESPFWEKTVEANVFAAHLDTTLALHRPGCPYKVTEALRTGQPFMAKHLPWYRNPRQPDAEIAYYQANRDVSVGYWNRDTLHPNVRAHLAAKRRGNEGGGEVGFQTTVEELGRRRGTS